jgi:hypothetical protein
MSIGFAPAGTVEFDDTFIREASCVGILYDPESTRILRALYCILR